jgi:anti-anti-sigma factor
MGHPGPPGVPRAEIYWPQRGVAQIVLVGEHDLASSADLDRTIDQTLSAGASRVVIDLSVVEFIDSSTINTLARAHRRAQDAGVGFCLVVDTDSIAGKALEITHLFVMLDRVETLEDALQLLEEGRSGSPTRDSREVGDDALS